MTERKYAQIRYDGNVVCLVGDETMNMPINSDVVYTINLEGHIQQNTVEEGMIYDPNTDTFSEGSPDYSKECGPYGPFPTQEVIATAAEIDEAETDTIVVTVGETVQTGTVVKFIAPCSCAGISNVKIFDKVYKLVDALGNPVTEVGGAFIAGAIVAIALKIKEPVTSKLSEQTTYIVGSDIIIGDEITVTASGGLFRHKTSDGSEYAESVGTLGVGEAPNVEETKVFTVESDWVSVTVDTGATVTIYCYKAYIQNAAKSKANAINVSYDNSESGIDAETVQEAIDVLKACINLLARPVLLWQNPDVNVEFPAQTVEWNSSLVKNNSDLNKAYDHYLVLLNQSSSNIAKIHDINDYGYYSYALLVGNVTSTAETFFARRGCVGTTKPSDNKPCMTFLDCNVKQGSTADVRNQYLIPWQIYGWDAISS